MTKAALFIGGAVVVVVDGVVSFFVMMLTAAACLGIYAYMSGTECKSVGLGDWFKVETCIRR